MTWRGMIGEERSPPPNSDGPAPERTGPHSLGNQGLDMAMDETADPLAQGRNFRTVEIHPPVSGHEYLDRFEAAIPAEGWKALFVHEFVCEVLDSVAQFLQGVTRFRSDAAPGARGLRGQGGGGTGEREVVGCGADHTVDPHPISRLHI